MRDIYDYNPNVLYEAWLEANKKRDPNFRDEDPLGTLSSIIEECNEAKINKETVPEKPYEELENHMVIGEYYDNEESEF